MAHSATQYIYRQYIHIPSPRVVIVCLEERILNVLTHIDRVSRMLYTPELALTKDPAWFSHVARAHRWVAPLTNPHGRRRRWRWRLDDRQALPSTKSTKHSSLTHPTTIRYVQPRPPCARRKPPNPELAQSAFDRDAT